MQRPFRVVDQNMLRSSELAQLLDQDARAHFVLPDLSLLEMTKTDQWEATLRGSLGTLSRHANRVHLCLSVGECLRSELGTLKSAEGHLLFREGTQFLRGILESVRRGENGSEMTRIRENYEESRAELAADYLDHRRNKEQVTSLVEATQGMLQSDYIARLRRGTATREQILTGIVGIAPTLLEEAFRRRGVNRQKMRVFLKKRPMVFRFICLKAWSSIYWVEKGGLDNLNPEKVTNDILDLEYILAASFFDGFLCRDKKAKSAYNDLVAMLKLKV